jgi:DNA-directed RNA polymerase subunit RPC12/RpoP
MQQVKICPDCTTEYFTHIEKCADCGTLLLSPEENNAAQEARKRLMAQTVQNSVAIRKGELKWIDELYHVVIDSGISCTVHVDNACNKGCCGDTWELLVSEEDAQRAQECIEKYFAEVHPEIRTAQELASEGKCPACGSPVDTDAVECSDCGLTLLIVEE